jgi:hypothetical protein
LGNIVYAWQRAIKGVKMSQSESDLPNGLAKPAQRALAGAGYSHLEQLTGVSEGEVLALHGMGPKAMRLLREALAEKGWSFAEALEGDSHF